MGKIFEFDNPGIIKIAEKLKKRDEKLKLKRLSADKKSKIVRQSYQNFNWGKYEKMNDVSCFVRDIQNCSHVIIVPFRTSTNAEIASSN